jgi:hypothetical protein
MVATPIQLQTGRLRYRSSHSTASKGRFAAARVRVMASAEATATEKLGVRVERNPPESRLSELGVRQWPK